SQSSYSVYSYAEHRALHSFPTRRSSDLKRIRGIVRAAAARDQRRLEPEDRVALNCAIVRAVTHDVLRAGQQGLKPGTLDRTIARSEEHTSELQSLRHLVCRLLLEKKKQT